MGVGPPSSVLGPTAGALIAIAACHAHAPAAIVHAPEPGISIAIYSAYAMIDDRRWIESDGKTIVLDRIDPGASLASLVIEPLAGGPLQIGRCVRDRLPDARYLPVVRCDVAGARGRYLVRAAYVSTALAYRGEHELALTTPGRASIVSRFALVTPAWRARAEVALYDGAPGERVRELARGEVALDGSTAVLAAPPRDVPARLLRVYEGAAVARDAGDDSGRDSSPLVWAWLELPHESLPPGRVHVRVELPDEVARELELPAAPRAADAAPGAQRLRLFADDDLHGTHQRTRDYREGAELAEHVDISIANTGATSREVWIEEPLRAARWTLITQAHPASLAADRDHARARVVVAPGKLARVSFTVAYGF